MPFIPLLWILTGIAAFASANHAVIGMRRGGDRRHAWFAVIGLVFAAYAASAVPVYQAFDIPSYVGATRVHVALGFLGWLALIGFTRSYTGQVHRATEALLVVAGVGLLVLNATLPFGFYVAEILSISPLTLPWGEVVALPEARDWPIWPLTSLIWWLPVGYGLWMARRQYRAGHRSAALVFGGSLLLFVATTLSMPIARVLFQAPPHLPLPVDEASFILFGLVMSAGLQRDAFRAQRAERALRDSEARLRAMVETAPDAIAILDLETGQFTESNARADRLLAREEGGTAREAGLAALEDGSTDGIALEDLLRRAEAGELVATLWIVRRPGQPPAPCDLQLTRLPHATRRLIRVSLLDVTERLAAESRQSRLEAQLRRAQKLETIGTLASGIAHDFNNLLVPILGYADLARERLDPADPLAEDLDSMTRAADRGRKLVRQLLAFSRGDQREAPGSTIDLHATVRETLQLLRATLPARIALESRMTSLYPWVRGDATEVQQVVLNLASNAMLAMPEGGTLTLAVEDGAPGSGRMGRSVCLTIADTGVGIPPDRLEQIFDPFYTTREAGHGTGLGLAVVQRITQQMGGTISVDSRPGLGARFVLEFPGAEAPEAPAPQTAGGTGSGAGIILVVDDEPQVADTFGRMLAVLGYQPRVVTDPHVALELFRTNPAPVRGAMLDLNMPGRNGLALAHALRALRADLPILVVSGSVHTPDVSLPPPFRRLLKPLTRKELGAALHDLLEGHAIALDR